MFRARKQLGKRQTADTGNGFRPKKFRTDQQVPTFDEGGQAAEDGEEPGRSSSKDGEDGVAANVGRYGRRVVRGQTGNVLLDCEIPRYGTPVERKLCRKAGDYIIGHELGTSPGVPQMQYLARKQGTDEYYLLKILSFDPETEIIDKDALQGKVLLHNEYTLLSMLDDLEGVIHQHGFFSDYAFEERQIETADGTVQSIYTGRIRRRLMLVLDCVHAHEFCERSSAYISLQRYITVTKYTEHEALQLFYEVVKVVEQLHTRNIIHRDLKLNNIVLNRRTKRIVLTNFFLGKQLISEQEVLYDQRGSPAYISPDVLTGKPYKGKPSDIWALGVILYTIIYGKFPFLDTTPAALFRKIREVDYTIPAGFKTSEKTNALIKSMLTYNPEERFTATEVRVQLEQILRKMRPVKLDIDQRVPELSEDEQATPSASAVRNGGPVDQSIPSEQDPVVTFSSRLRPQHSSAASTAKPMDVDVDASATAPEPASPKHELSTEQFSRVLESNQQRHELGPDGFPRPKASSGKLTAKKITKTLRFTPSPAGSLPNQLSFSGGAGTAAAAAAAGGGSGGGSSTVRNSGQGGGAGSLNGATGGLLQPVSRSLSPVASGTPAGGNGGVGAGSGQRNRYNINLNVQYSARSYNSAARAVAAAVAAVRGAGAVATGPGVEWIGNGIGNGAANGGGALSNGSNHLGFTQSLRTVRNSSGGGVQASDRSNSISSPVSIRAQANTSPQPAASTTPRPSPGAQGATTPRGVAPQSLPPAAQRLYAIMNNISLLRAGRGAQPSPDRSPPVNNPAAVGNPGLDFDGIITQEIADTIVPFLIVNLRHHEWAVELFRAINGGNGAGEPEQRVNNLLELLRQLGVRMEARNGQIVIRPEQTRERHQFLGVLLRIAGFNDKYFTQSPAQPSQPLA